MRCVIQRVKNASVQINDRINGAIESGLLVLAAMDPRDSEEDLGWMASKIVALRIFEDEQGKMNRSVADTGGDILLVSQFTLLASTRKGNRPSFHLSASPDLAIPLYSRFHDLLEQFLGKRIPQGIFGADMDISLVNHGPVTIIIDSLIRE